MDIREIHGVAIRSDLDRVLVTEREECVKIRVQDEMAGREVFLSPNEARHVATKLRRLARRIDDRLGS